jgi:hypothetical protein
VAREISIIPYPQQFVKRKVAQIFVPKKSRICAKLPIDFCVQVWYNVIVERERGTHQTLSSLDKNSKFPLDKTHKVWYNKGVKGKPRE